MAVRQPGPELPGQPALTAVGRQPEMHGEYRSAMLEAARQLDRAEAFEQFAVRYADELSDDYLSQHGSQLGRANPAREAAIAHALWRHHCQVSGTAEISVTLAPDPHDGQQSVLTILHPDMPFITDSVLMELSSREIAIHFLQNLKLDGRLLLYAEIDPLDEGEQTTVRERLESALQDVRAAVRDYGPMRAQVQTLIDTLELLPDRKQATQAEEYLQWLLEDHFTFLGYREFDYGGDRISQVAGTELGIFTTRAPATSRALNELLPQTRAFLEEPNYLSFSKAGTRSRVHRPAYPDYVAVKKFDQQGRVVGEYGFVGLYTSPVYTDHPTTIPVLRDKAREVLARADLDPQSFDGKNLAQVLVTYPRDELFQSSIDELYRTSMAVAHLHERRQTRLFVRAGRYGLFYNCLVYVPRELYNTRLRTGIESLLMDAFSAEDIEFDAFFSESILVRLQMTLRVPPGVECKLSERELEQRVVELAQDWRHEMRKRLRALGQVVRFSELLGGTPRTYEDTHSLDRALADYQSMERLGPDNDLCVDVWGDAQQTILQLIHEGAHYPLAQVIPILENLGLNVVAERSFSFCDAKYSVQEYVVDVSSLGAIETADRDRLTTAFYKIWSGQTDDDRFNQLILSVGLNWRQVALVRALAAYLKQAGFGYDEQFLATALSTNSELTRALIGLFEQRFDPEVAGEEPSIDIEPLFDAVVLLNEDRALRKLFEVLESVQRTNYFVRTDEPKAAFHTVLKLTPATISNMPQPVPAVELFVHGPLVEGVHLRSSRVARGGLRWSDRTEDYRTEVLDLMKTQVVKNAVIVPSGAKGGFLLRRELDVRGLSLSGEDAYRIFVSGLLSVTDNLVNGAVHHPDNVVCRDEEDPYLVVAADKGTATFSDVANEIAQAHGFWLDDAFASGGATGYDHKQVGITARGAWVSVQRHFAERDIDPQTQPTTVIGIGDMSGDVFGNGLLSSRALLLVGAFNHKHIFLDPNPDASASFAERQRLFDTRGGWDAYDTSLISSGGGVFERTRKSIPVSEEVAERLKISAGAYPPDELIRVLLKAPVDLLWNGGVGTYVKASTERNEDVGDRNNDALRINAEELRVKVVGEGGNLGFTQAARVAYALTGGAINTDFVDNSGGVDCSDREVNLKILLGSVVATGDLDLAGRNQLMRDNEEAVAELVLANNARQARALSLAVQHCGPRVEEYARFASFLEDSGELDRALHSWPSNDELLERQQDDAPLTRPELAVLMSSSKNWLKRELLEAGANFGADEQRLLAEEFPSSIAQRHATLLPQHRLAREIIATQLAGEIVDYMGMTFVHRLQEFTGESVANVVAAYLVVSRLFRFKQLFAQIENSAAHKAEQVDVLLDYIRLGRRVTRWMLLRHRADLAVEALVARYEPLLEQLQSVDVTLFMSRAQRRRYRSSHKDLAGVGFDADLAQRLATATDLSAWLSVAQIAGECGIGADDAARLFAATGKLFNLDTLHEELTHLEVTGHWRLMERDALLDDLLQIQVNLARSIAASGTSLEEWRDANAELVQAWVRTFSQYRQTETRDFAYLALMVRKLAVLAG